MMPIGNRVREHEELAADDMTPRDSRAASVTKQRNKISRQNSSPKSQTTSISTKTSQKDLQQQQSQQMVFDLNLNPVVQTASIDPSSLDSRSSISDAMSGLESTFCVPSIESNGSADTIHQHSSLTTPDASFWDYLSSDALNSLASKEANGNCHQDPGTVPSTSVRSVESYFTGPGGEYFDNFHMNRSDTMMSSHMEFGRPIRSDSNEFRESIPSTGRSYTGARCMEITARDRLESKIAMAISSIKKLYDSGVYLDLLHEDARIYGDLETLQFRLHGLIQSDSH
jgi:hypothetical protein